MGRHLGLLYPPDNVNTEFTSSETPISRSNTQSQLSLVVALLSLYSLCWECTLLFITFNENVGLGIYCHRACSVSGIFFAENPRYLLPVSQLLLLQQARGTGFDRWQVPKAPWPRTRAGASDAPAGLSQEQLVPPPGHGTHRSSAGGVGPSAGLHGTHALLWHGQRVSGTGRTPAVLSWVVLCRTQKRWWSFPAQSMSSVREESPRSSGERQRDRSACSHPFLAAALGSQTHSPQTLGRSGKGTGLWDVPLQHGELPPLGKQTQVPVQHSPTLPPGHFAASLLQLTQEHKRCPDAEL